MAQALSIEDIRNSVIQVAPLYDVKRVVLFGSYAEGRQTKTSDIDLLVEFPTFTSYFDVFGMQDELKEKIGKNVDIVPAPIQDDSFLEIKKEITLYEQNETE